MPTFASTTTSGYSDPLKAMSIKALEQRLKDQQAQMAQQQPDAAMMGTIPGGIGHVLGVVGDRMAQGRNEQAIAAQKQELAQRMSGYDPTGDAPPPAAIAPIAPDLYKDMMQAWIGYRQAKMSDTTQRYTTDSTAKTATAGHEVTRANNEATVGATLSGQSNQAAIETARIEAAERAAAKLNENEELKRQATAEEARQTALRKVESDKQAKIDEFERNRTLPQNDLEKLTQSLGRKPTEDEVKAAINKLTSKPASEEKLLIEERNKAVGYQSDLKQLDKAYELISSPKGIHSGSSIGTPLKTAIGSAIPQSLGGPDDETQANTMQFNLIMKGQGLQNLLAMKGASSDTDVRLNLEIANDVKQPIARRKEALGFARDRLYTIAKANEEDLKRIGGAYPTLQTAPGGEDPKIAAAKAWLADPANKNDPDYAAVQRKVGGK